MALAQAPDRRVARHRAQRFHAQSHKGSRRAHAGRSCCCFGSGMTAANHDDIVVFHVEHSLLADAETGEDLAEEVVNIHAAHKRVQRPHSPPQMVRRQFDARVIPYHFRP